MGHCQECPEDLRFLKRKTRPSYEDFPDVLRIVDLFSGCGGLSLGLAEAARRCEIGTDVALAVDWDEYAADVFEANFPDANVKCEDIATLFDGKLGERATRKESSVRREVGEVDVLFSGAPCQGHSNLNNHTRRRDPRNGLYIRSVRAAEILLPTVVVLENVPAVRHDTRHVVAVAKRRLAEAGYLVDEDVLNLADLGVPQVRRRHFLVGFLDGCGDPSNILDVATRCPVHETRSVKWAIDDLRALAWSTEFDSASWTSDENYRRIRWLFEKNKFDLPNKLRPVCHRGTHSYTSMYGRLRWNRPAQTITTGFGSMGQGRYVHPSQRRTLTPHEAARLQTFPDFFDFGDAGRGAWASMIGNAVPPLVTLNLGTRILNELDLAPATQGRERQMALAS